MSAIAAPKIDSRRIDDLISVLKDSASKYWPDWKAQDSPDFGMALFNLAARMGEVIIEQLNRVPEKNFLAFLDLLGIDLQPGKAARAPLTFYLVDKATDDALIPQGTKVGVAKLDEVVFETEEDLFVSRGSLSRVYSLNPDQDRFVDARDLLSGTNKDPKPIFFDPASAAPWQPIDHALYIGHDTLFEVAAAAGKPVTLTFGFGTSLQSSTLSWQYSTKTGWKPVNPQAEFVFGTFTFDVGEIDEANLKGYDGKGSVIDKSSYWLAARMSPVSKMLPKIPSVTGTVTIAKDGLTPHLAFFNNTPIDLTKDFYPFGERPKFNDTFYLSSSEVLSKPGASVTIHVEFSKITGPAPNATAKLTWEYWNGTQWAAINGVSDKTNHLKTDGDITFKCPDDIKSTTVNGKEDYWIRARIQSGNYGTEAGYQPTSGDEFKTAVTSAKLTPDQEKLITGFLNDRGLLNSARYNPPSFQPPSLKSVKLGYQYQQTENSGFTILTANNSQYSDIGDQRPFQPFNPADETFPSLYLGFDIDPAKPLRSMPLSLYFSIAEPLYGQGKSNGPSSSGDLPAVAWHYWDGNQWLSLPVQDETDNFSEAGRVRLIAPEELAERALFGDRLFWIKASLESGKYASPPELLGIFSNTVWAQHGVTFRGQVLGSSNGEAGQVLSFSKAPVLEGQVIEVREPVVPSETEMQNIISEEGGDAVRTVKDDAGNISEVWVRWHEVNTFTLSHAVDRHYRVDRLNGQLFFGDGVRGLIPAPGKDNIKARFYRVGGGAAGNRPAGKITELKTTYPFVDSVTNHEASAGGSDQGLLDEVIVRAPRQIKCRDRAVTVEDFEWLARQASDEVANVRCLPRAKLGNGGAIVDSPGWVTLIIVPSGEEDQPIPTQGLINVVKNYLADRSLATMKDQIDVVGPSYTKVSVTTTIRPQRIEDSKATEKRVSDNLKKFLHPTRGGPDFQGWDFGRTVYLSEIASVIQGTEGVDQIYKIDLDPSPESGVDGQDKTVLPSSGLHTIKSLWS